MKPLTIIGLVLVAGGIACTGGAGLVLYKTMDADARADRQLDLRDKQCLSQLRKLGHVKENGNHFEVSVPVGSPRQALGDATAAAAICPHRTITQLCIGTDCTDPNSERGGSLMMKFTLTRTL